MSASRTPLPETRDALLPSYGCGRVTRHHYVTTRKCEVPGPRPPAWEHIFKCAVTGVERRWGVEERVDK